MPGKLADAGLLLKERVGNQVHYSANRDCPVYEELASILRKTSGMVDVLADALLPLVAQIEVAFVRDVLAKPKLFVKGGQDDLGQSGRKFPGEGDTGS